MWQRCRRRWFIHYYLGYQLATQLPYGTSLLGTRVHAAMQGHYGHGIPAPMVAAALYAVAERADPDYERELRAEYDLASAMIEGWLEYEASEGLAADIEVIAVERDVQVPLPGYEGIMLRAKLDQVYRRISTGLTGFMDWKTAANFDKHALISNDPQMRFYSLIQHIAAGHLVTMDGVDYAPGKPAVDGGMITTLRRCKRTAQSKPPYFQRDEFRISPASVGAAYAKVAGLCSEIIDTRDTLDTAYQVSGGDLRVVTAVMRARCPDTWIADRCKWDCPLAAGLCGAMDDGSDWAGMLTRGGAWVQRDPYQYYAEDPLAQARKALATL